MSSLPQDNSEDLVSADDGLSQGAGSGDASATAHALAVRYAGQTAVGLVREHNEDNLVISSLSSEVPAPRGEVRTEAVGSAGMMFAVCDGMGGAAAGEVASQMAVDILLEALKRGGDPEARDDLARRLVSAVEEAGQRIYDTAQSERSKRGMGTTATVAALVDKVLFVAEVGDSRAYLLRNGELKQLTKDQSLVNQLIEAGHLTEEEAEAFEHSNIILQALGTSDSVQVDLTFVELRRGDRLMLCSDGLSGLVHDDSIRDALAEFVEPVECCDRLIEYAEAGGGHDNITVIVADFDGRDLVEPKPTDTFGYLQYPLIPAATSGQEATTDTGYDPHRAETTPAPAADSGAWSWIVAGLVALLVGGGVLMLSSSPPQQADAADDALPVAHPAPEVASAPKDDLVDAKVDVTVHTDLEAATLLVNGETHGQLASAEQRLLSLAPGAYRFEAEADGDVVAVAVVTVRPDVPMDVRLDMPRGTELGQDDSESDAPEQAPSKAPVDGTAKPAPSLKKSAAAKRRTQGRNRPTSAASQQAAVVPPAPVSSVGKVAVPAAPIPAVRSGAKGAVQETGSERESEKESGSSAHEVPAKAPAKTPTDGPTHGPTKAPIMAPAPSVERAAPIAPTVKAETPAGTKLPDNPF